MEKKAFLPVIAGTLLLGGCSGVSIGPEYSAFGDGRVTAAGANQLFTNDQFEKVDLIHALDPDGEAKKKISKAEKPNEKLQIAYEAFYKHYDDRVLRRNRIQDQILTASEQRCNLFKIYIKRIDSYQKITSGSLATVLGGLGAIFTPASTARALSGSAAIVTGVGAEFSHGFFSDMAIHVLVPGIEARQQQLREAIDEKQKTSIELYPVEEAVTDAVRFHGACSINVALDVAGKAVKEIRNPGAEAMEKSLLQAARLKQYADGIKTGEIKSVTMDGKPIAMDNGLSVSGPQTNGTAISLLSASAFPPGLGSFIHMSKGLPIQRLSEVRVDITNKLNKLKEAVKTKQGKQKAANADLDNSLLQIEKALDETGGIAPAGGASAVSVLQQLTSLEIVYNGKGTALLTAEREAATADKDSRKDKEVELYLMWEKFRVNHLERLHLYWKRVVAEIERAHVQNEEGEFDALRTTVTDLNKTIDTILN